MQQRVARSSSLAVPPSCHSARQRMQAASAGANARAALRRAPLRMRRTATQSFSVLASDDSKLVRPCILHLFSR